MPNPYLRPLADCRDDIVHGRPTGTVARMVGLIHLAARWETEHPTPDPWELVSVAVNQVVEVFGMIGDRLAQVGVVFADMFKDLRRPDDWTVAR